MHVVLDEENANALIAYLTDKVHDLARFFKPQTGGRFIEKEQTGSESKRTSDFQTLFKPKGKIFGHLFSIRKKTGLLKERLNFFEDVWLAKWFDGLPERRIETMSKGYQNIGLNIQILEGTDNLKSPADTQTTDLVWLQIKNGLSLETDLST
jgi:hypothetical protein